MLTGEFEDDEEEDEDDEDDEDDEEDEEEEEEDGVDAPGLYNWMAAVSKLYTSSVSVCVPERKIKESLE